MDFLNEAIALGIDTIIIGFCLKEYFESKRDLHNLKNAPTLLINSELENHVSAQKDKKVPYAIIRGTVSPLAEPLVSRKVPEVKSVISVHKLRDHRVSRGFSGFWTEKDKLFHISLVSIPFELIQNNYGVEVLEPLSAEILDLQLIHDSYQPTPFSLWDHLFGFIVGVQQKGVQTTEEVLRCGTYLTAVGELSMQNGKLYLGPSTEGPLFLTTAPKSYLINMLASARNASLLKVLLTGSLAAVLIGVIIRKVLARRRQDKEAQKLREAVEAENRKRRINCREIPTEENQCVVCQQNPKEIICLPCGHVCMCIDCSDRTKKSCPICRAPINSRCAAFIT